MDPQKQLELLDNMLPTLLGIATLLPLLSFFLILIGGKWMGKAAGYLASAAIVGAAILSFVGLFLVWLPVHLPHLGPHHDEQHEGDHGHGSDHAERDEQPESIMRLTAFAVEEEAKEADKAEGAHGAGDDQSHADAKGHHAEGEEHAPDAHASGDHDDAHHDAEADHEHGEAAGPAPPKYTSGDYYLLGQFGKLKVSISYYIDALTMVMFCMVTLIASAIHLYASGYMSDELVDEYTDHEAEYADGSHVKRPGRYHRFFQALSLFCFSMLGLVLAGNIAMVFVFWELVGICSYFLIGFYIERKSASNAANKAFIVNRVGDFGMILGLMALWSGLGTFAFGDSVDESGHVQHGIFSLVRPAEADEHGHHHQLTIPDGMVQMGAGDRAEKIFRDHAAQADGGIENAQSEIDANYIGEWRKENLGYGLLIVAGIGIFCGCVGKSAQFPLHVWLPDAMEGPTPVSALVHSATMVAAGVYLVGRFFPVFVPEVLFVIAITGVITLFMAATIAITATDIKRVLAYSTVSQLGYMMLALGVGGWVAGLMHLVTHAFFKSLLFMCSGSVIHAVHTNEMTEMGGLRKKMPITAYTMLIGCLAIAGVSLPFVVGFSGYYSKDMILEQAFSFMQQNSGFWGGLFFASAAGGAAITAFYMFRMWYLTFAGEPRNQERYDHAHESPPSMWIPLVICAVFAVGVAWRSGDHALLAGIIPTPFLGSLIVFLGSLIVIGIGVVVWFFAKKQSDGQGDHAHGHGHDDHGHDDHGHGHDTPKQLSLLPLVLGVVALVVTSVWSIGGLSSVNLHDLLEYARPKGTEHTNATAIWMNMTWPYEHFAHEDAQYFTIVVPVTLLATLTALGGIGLATAMYCLNWLDPADVRKQFSRTYDFLLNKWWFDELYHYIFFKPTHWVSNLIAMFDQKFIDALIDGLANCVVVVSRWWTWISDQTIVEGTVNGLARCTYALGVKLRLVQTGRLRQYVVFIVVGAIAIFVIMSFFAGPVTVEAPDVSSVGE